MRRVARLWAAIFAAALLVALTASACSGSAEIACGDGAERFVEYRLFLGRSSDGVEVVSDAAWQDFLQEAVTPRFPDGLTTLDAAGQWRGSSGLTQTERTKLLVILAPPGAEPQQRIDEVAAEYKSRFAQEAVLAVTEEVCVSFS